jgi:hypothetical protein
LILCAALVAVTLSIWGFYQIENWRGRRAWNQCVRDLGAKGETVDWKAFVPAPIQPERNFFSAPGMAVWFSKKNAQANRNVGVLDLPPWMGNAEWSLGQLMALPERFINQVDSATAILPGGSDKIIPLIIAEEVPPIDFIRNLAREANLKFVAVDPGSWPSNATAEISLRVTDRTARSVLADVLKQRGLVSCWDDKRNELRIQLGESRAELRRWLAAGDSEYQQLKLACQRDLAQLEGSYLNPISMDVPNYVNVRTVARALATRARMNLLDHQPEAAVETLSLLNRVAEAVEDDRSLVGPMLRCKVLDIYVGTVCDGLGRNCWREAELKKIQDQVRGTDLLTGVSRGLRADRAAWVWSVEHPPPPDATTYLSSLCFPLTLPGPRVWPRGWILQNEAAYCSSFQVVLDAVETRDRRIRATGLTLADRKMRAPRNTPYGWLATRTAASFARAVESAAGSQTLVDELFVACALERYRSARGEYPDRLEALVPTFVDRIPKDLFASAPLRYARDRDGSYRLWSVGWNERDDGGVSAATNRTSRDGPQPDWVWFSPRKVL